MFQESARLRDGAGEKKGLLSILRTEPSGILSRTIYFIKRNIWIQSLNDTILLIVRVLGSSCIKDALVTVLHPIASNTTVAKKLVDKVEQRTFNQSWIPENAIQRDHADATGERPEKSTAIYAFGHAILIVTKKLIGIFNTCSMTALLWTQNSIAFVMNTAFSVIVFTARSLLCSVVSVLIVLLHMVQTVLRAFRYVYRWFEYILSFVCAITNDISLLAVEVVQESAVTKGEDMLEPFRSFDSGLDGASSSSLLLPGNGGDRLKQVAEYQPSEDSDQS